MTHRMLATGLALFAAFPAAAAHPHYEGLLREGTFALQRGELQEAVHDLRLACFGLLEEPPTLAVCLARLALAQAGTGDDQGFRETFGRVVDVEERFRAYSEGELEPELRAAFEREVAARVPARLLETTPLARLVATGGQPSVETAEAEPPPPEAGAGEPEEPPPALTPEDRALLDRARELMQAARTHEELAEAFRLAEEVADAYPASRTAQYLAAEIAYRASRWGEAVTYFRRGGDPADGNPMLLFYLAVSLYEAGEQAAAEDALRRSLPRIEHTPFVRSYRSKILGEEDGPPAPGGGP